MEPRDLVKAWVEAFNRADVEALADMYGEDATNHQVAERPVVGRAAIRDMFASEFARARMVCIVENIFQDGEWAILEWRDPLGLRGCGFFHVVDGRIRFQRGYWDKRSFVRVHGSGGTSGLRIGLDHAHVFASNIQETVGFFRTMFGAQIVWDEEAAGARSVRLALGHAFIHVYDQPPRAPRGGAIHHLGIETDDLDALVRRMRERGFQFRKPIREEPRFRYVMVNGPDDLLIELFQCRETERWRIDRPESTC